MLSIEHLSVEYERRGTVIPAVRDVSFTVNRGETVGLVGESGSGKSTIALAILRLIEPQEGRITAGRILFEGQDLLTLPDPAIREIRGRRIAMIFQDPFTSLNPVLRLQDQMMEVLVAHRLPPDRSRLEAALARVQLDPVRTLQAYPHQLSGGQRQRVMIAMALLGEPALLLADEPTTALDVLVQREILELLFRLQKELGVGLLFITHNLTLMAHYAHRIGVLQAGRLVEMQAASDLFRNPAEPYTRQLLAAIPRLNAG